MGLRPYQEEGVSAIRDAFASGHRSVLYTAPTGSGKTVLFSHIARCAVARGTRICIVVHRRELMDQVSERLTLEGIVHARIEAGTREAVYPDCDTHFPCRAYVAMAQTLVRRTRYRFGLVIVDEAHHAAASTYQAILSRQPDAHVLGVTATPCRLTGSGLRDIFDTIVIGPSTRSLIESGYLSRYRYFCPELVSLRGIHSRGGDYVANELESLMNRREITGCVIEHYRRHLDGRPAIAFCTTLRHADAVAEQFLQAGYVAAVIDSRLSKAERWHMARDFRDGLLNVLVSVDVISEGYDVPGAVGAILLRPTQSLAVHLQQVGRVLRPDTRKEHAIILDHVGNCIRHGLPDTDRHWTLESGAKEQGQPRIRQCGTCYFVFESGVACPNCGAAMKHDTEVRAAPSSVKGQLTEITQADEETIEMLWKQAHRTLMLRDFHRWARAAGCTTQKAFTQFKLARRRYRMGLAR